MLFACRKRIIIAGANKNRGTIYTVRSGHTVNIYYYFLCVYNSAYYYYYYYTTFIDYTQQVSQTVCNVCVHKHTAGILYWIYTAQRTVMFRWPKKPYSIEYTLSIFALDATIFHPICSVDSQTCHARFVLYIINCYKL